MNIKLRRHKYAVLFLVVLGIIMLYLANNTNYRNYSAKFQESIGETYHYYFNLGQKINPVDQPFMINSTVCQEKSPFLLIFVISMHGHLLERNAIRQTWGSLAKGKSWPHRDVNITIKVVFLFGVHSSAHMNNEVIEESKKYNDIVMANFTESYRNLTEKVLHGLKWQLMFCSRAHFVMKVDEDTFVNIPMVSNYIQSHQMTKTIVGFVRLTPLPFRIFTKYTMGWNEYPYFFYPSFTSGNFYFFSSETAKQLFAVSEYIPYVSMEDVFVSGILAEVIGANRRMLPDKLYVPDTSTDDCDFTKDKKMASDHILPEKYYKIWKNIEHPEMCS